MAQASTTPQRIALRRSQLAPGFEVGRALPTKERRQVGAWCFLDHIGPVAFEPGAGMHVGTHPHTCLQTFTWMIAGELIHRDSLGTEQRIRPGQVNLMTAGHGITHTEDSTDDSRELHAVQLWIALPPELADIPPDFAHYAKLPRWQHQQAEFILLAGEYQGHRADTAVHSPLLGLDLRCPAGTALTLPLRADFEYGWLPLIGKSEFAGTLAGPEDFVYLPPGATECHLRSEAGCHGILLGGEPLRQAPILWWNFVAHSRAAIAEAQAAWEAGSARFPGVPGDGGHRLNAPRLPW